MTRRSRRSVRSAATASGDIVVITVESAKVGRAGPGLAQGSSIAEGIGTTRITANLEGTPIDDAVQVDDPACVAMVYHLLREEGLFVGGSSGINLAAAVQVARQLGPGHTIVTLLCDRGGLYAGRLFNPEWLREKGLAEAAGIAVV